MLQDGQNEERFSNLVEIVLNSNDSYQTSIEKACSVLGMPTEHKDLTLLRMSGSIIPDNPLDATTKLM